MSLSRNTNKANYTGSILLLIKVSLVVKHDLNGAEINVPFFCGDNIAEENPLTNYLVNHKESERK